MDKELRINYDSTEGRIEMEYGEIVEVRVFPHALTEAQVNEEFNSMINELKLTTPPKE